jgi:hypothetical protein
VIFGKFPFVASPFDSDLVRRSKLVGFLLHPVPRSGTWRSLMLSRPLSLPLAQGLLRLTKSGGRVDLEEKTTNRQRSNFTEKWPFSQGDGIGLWIIKALIILRLQTVYAVSSLVAEPEDEGESRFAVWVEWALRASA